MASSPTTVSIAWLMRVSSACAIWSSLPTPSSKPSPRPTSGTTTSPTATKDTSHRLIPSTTSPPPQGTCHPLLYAPRSSSPQPSSSCSPASTSSVCPPSGLPPEADTHTGGHPAALRAGRTGRAQLAGLGARQAEGRRQATRLGAARGLAQSASRAAGRAAAEGATAGHMLATAFVWVQGARTRAQGHASGPQPEAVVSPAEKVDPTCRIDPGYVWRTL
mmetsp:Transcript_5973/g.15124  ORF Transcript_5973/g.15124 Transcript_5973/m.15124 type:complete len:219 (+) Transcript_5973:706-1362(+)